MLLNMVMFKVTICDFGKMNINMTDITEKTENGELVTNRDQLVVVDNIESLIKVIRGQQVMLDRDLATLYGVETKRLNEQVKRNIKRFPEDFMFQLTKDECLRSQIATLNKGRGQHLKYMPYVFTENGVAMLSSVLRSDTAIEVNIRIMYQPYISCIDKPISCTSLYFPKLLRIDSNLSCKSLGLYRSALRFTSATNAVLSLSLSAIRSISFIPFLSQ